jgi:preprotein translocase subunit SecE
MSRAVRRGQSQNSAESGIRRPLGPRTPRQTRGAKPPSQQRRGFRLKVPGFLEDIFSELKKVTWPTRQETAYLTMVVIIVAVAAGIVLGLVDVVFSWLIDQLLLS